MNRPVWLFSLDGEDFTSAPLTTGALLAHFLAHGRSAPTTDVELVHFTKAAEARRWIKQTWPTEAQRARAALEQGVQPVVGLSCYLWNIEQMLEIAATAKAVSSEILVVAGGPHVQRAEDYLQGCGIDVVVIAEGEITFTELLDGRDRSVWPGIAGISYRVSDADGGGTVVCTPARPRTHDLDTLPSAVRLVPLRDTKGRPYEYATYETERGCPFQCSFCEWGTGATGRRMFQHSAERIADDLEGLVAGGIENIYIADSNFGGLPGDVATAAALVDLRARTGRPKAVVTSWAKHATPRVLDIVRSFHRNGMLKSYTLSLQTLTPAALELCRRKNMPLNNYRSIARAMAAEGVPVRTELIWPLPGDTLPDLCAGLDELFCVFPDVQLYGFVLLPGTEFFDRRHELAIRTQRLSPYAGLRGNYVVSTFSCPRPDAVQGYLLIAAQMVLTGPGVLPLATRYLALDRQVSACAVLLDVLSALAEAFPEAMDGATADDELAVFECRTALRMAALGDLERTFAIVRDRVTAKLSDVPGDVLGRVLRVLSLDEALSARPGLWDVRSVEFDFQAQAVVESLKAMERPEDELFASGHDRLELTFLPFGKVGVTVIPSWEAVAART